MLSCGTFRACRSNWLLKENPVSKCQQKSAIKTRPHLSKLPIKTAHPWPRPWPSGVRIRHHPRIFARARRTLCVGTPPAQHVLRGVLGRVRRDRARLDGSRAHRHLLQSLSNACDMTGAFARAGDVIPPRRALACPSRRCRRLGNILANIRASPPPVSDADTSPVVAEAKDLEKRIHTISGRIAQLDMNLRTCCDDLTAINDSIRRLKRTVADLPADSKARVAAEQSLYSWARDEGRGPRGRARRLPQAPSQRQVHASLPRRRRRRHVPAPGESPQGEGGILLLRRDRPRSRVPAWPIFLLYLNGERQRRVVAGQGAFAGISLVTIFPVLVQFYWCWMLYFYAALALRKRPPRQRIHHPPSGGSTTTTTPWACASSCSPWTSNPTRA